MNILWLTWRDVKNPEAGGAEKVTIEVAKRFARDGSSVTIFSSRYKKSKNNERIFGVNIIRKGNKLTCRIHAFFYYLNNKQKIDLVIDEINTLPFFAFLYAGQKTRVLIHQLAKEYWWSEIFFPLSLIGFFLEPIYLRFCRNTPTITVSKSTATDLKKLGFKKITIIREGLTFKPQLPKIKEDLVLFIGRLTKPKKPDDAIMAFRKIHNSSPNTKLVVIGRDDKNYLDYLKNLVKKFRLTNHVIFTGLATEQEKINYLKKAKVVLIPGIREGWNLVTCEANATGCVPVGYNIAGLKDSIKNNVTGLLVKSSPDSLAQAALKGLGNDKLRKKLIQNGFKLSQQYSWENTYQDFKASL